MGKLFNSERGWKVVDDTMQVRGGRGYETAESLEARGEAPIAVEQALRSMRINRIFEGSSEIMRLFIAREAVDPHLKKAGAVADPDAGLGEKAKDAVGLGVHMAGWMSKNAVGWSRKPSYQKYGDLSGHVAFVDRSARRLARTMAQAMARYGPKLERRQAVLFRFVDIGAELYAMAAVCAYARAKKAEGQGDETPVRLADLFCRQSRQRVEDLFDHVFNDTDRPAYEVAREILDGDYRWLEKGIFSPPAPEGIEREEDEGAGARVGTSHGGGATGGKGSGVGEVSGEPVETGGGRD